jgi:hypothetical protein
MRQDAWALIEANGQIEISGCENGHLKIYPERAFIIAKPVTILDRETVELIEEALVCAMGFYGSGTVIPAALKAVRGDK